MPVEDGDPEFRRSESAYLQGVTGPSSTAAERQERLLGPGEHTIAPPDEPERPAALPARRAGDRRGAPARRSASMACVERSPMPSPASTARLTASLLPSSMTCAGSQPAAARQCYASSRVAEPRSRSTNWRPDSVAGSMGASRSRDRRGQQRRRLIGKDRFGDQLVGLRRAADEGEVELARYHRRGDLTGVADADFQRHVRIRGMESAQVCGRNCSPTVLLAPMTSRPLLRPSRSRTSDPARRPAPGSRLAWSATTCPVGVGTDAATRALEQGRAVVALQGLDLGRDCRLADPFGLGGRRHRAVFDHGEEDGQGVQAGTLDHVTSPVGYSWYSFF